MIAPWQRRADGAFLSGWSIPAPRDVEQGNRITKGRPVPTRPVKLKAPRRLPGSLTVVEVTTILTACTRLRDRFLIALLAETGMRIGQALGLRHADFVSRRREVTIIPRNDNANGARAKTRTVTTVPAVGIVHGRRDEPLRHRGHQRAGHDRHPTMVLEEPDHTEVSLQLRHVEVEKQPVDALHLQRDVIAQHLSSGSGYGHHRLRSCRPHAYTRGHHRQRRLTNARLRLATADRSRHMTRRAGAKPR